MNSETNAGFEFEPTERPVIFGLTYLEEEDIEINDVVGCLTPGGGYSNTGCDDSDVPPGTQIP